MCIVDVDDDVDDEDKTTIDAHCNCVVVLDELTTVSRKGQSLV